MVDMSATFDEVYNSLVSLVFTRSKCDTLKYERKDRPQQLYYIPSATRDAGISTSNS